MAPGAVTNHRVGVAIIGAGMAGGAHAFGYRNAKMHPDLGDIDIDLVAVVDANEKLAASAATQYGFDRVHTNVDALLGDDALDAVSVALPNNQYAEVIPKVLAAGKHVIAEKPLGRSATEALRLANLAETAGRVHCVSFSWRRMAAVEGVARLVRDGAIGAVRHLSAWYLTDYAASPDTPMSWRYDKAAAGGGAILDIGPHIVAVLDHVVGSIERVISADQRTVISARPVPAGIVIGHSQAATTGEMTPVTTDDVTTWIAEFASGAVGHVTVSRVATGVPNSLGFQIIGSEGSVSFDSSHPDEFQLYTNSGAQSVLNGARTVIVGPEYPSFRHTVPMPARGVGSGYGATFVAQAQDFVLAISNGGAVETDFWTGYRIMLVCSAVQQAAEQSIPVDIARLDRELRSQSMANKLVGVDGD